MVRAQCRDTIDDHFPFPFQLSVPGFRSSFPFPLSVPAFRSRFPFPTCPLMWVGFVQARPGYKMDGVLPKTLERKDLDIICPRKIRNRIADKIIDEWDLVGRELDVSDKKLKSIRDDRALTLPEKKAVAVLDAWAEEHGRGATCLKLAEALYRRIKTGVIEILCDEVTQMKRDTTMSGAGAAVPPQPSDIQQQEQGETK